MAYLTHDTGKALTAHRVAWTHTLNLANDDVASAALEMASPARNAGLLKADAGVRKGGSEVEKPVRHFSLNWHPSEAPSKAGMLEAAASFLEHLGWQKHQCVLVAHTDRKHAHVHGVVNAIHPETGRKLDDGFEKRRAQIWAEAHEQARGQIYCLGRQWRASEREADMPRPAWIGEKDQIRRELQSEVMRAAETVWRHPSYLPGR